MFPLALGIISEESGVAINDLTDETVFANLGVDSLLSLVIGSRIREELCWDFDVETMLISFPTVEALRLHIQEQSLDGSQDLHMSNSSLSLLPTASDSNSSPISGPSRPPSEFPAMNSR